MVIFGVALLATCMIVGLFIGEVLGFALGIHVNVGGVGIAMVMLIFIVDYLKKRNKLSKPAQDGINFWNTMYVPIVIAMAASQNVIGALDSGMVAILAGVFAVMISWLFVPVLSGMGGR